MSDAPDELSVLAGEYVLGMLDENEAASVRRRAEIDPILARAIGDWESRFAPLAELVPPVAAPPMIWDRIERSLDAAQSPAPPTGYRPEPRGTRFWRATTAAALALAAVFAAIAYLPRNEAPPRLAALGVAGAPAPAFIAEARGDGYVTLTSVSPAPVPTGRDLELWLLPKGATTVTSLGLLLATGRRLAVPGLADGAQLLVSLEPQGGSPTGQPTGAVLYGGTLITR